MNTITMTMNRTRDFFYFLQIKMKQEAEANRGFVENVPDLEIPPVAMLPTNSNVICRPCQIPLLSNGCN
jgi:hypothetical protein